MSPARQETALAERLKDAIKSGGPISVSDFMSRCLWDDRFGYYRTRPVIGAAGDFITAAEVSQVFGEIVGLWSAVVWQQVMQAPGKVTLVEYGPGRATMMRDALRAARVVKGFMDATRVHLVEMSEALASLQRATLEDCGCPVSWGQNLVGFESPAIVLANEFLDSWPISQWIRTVEGWRERAIGLDEKNELCFTTRDGPPPQDTVSPSLMATPRGGIVESQRPRLFAEALRKLSERGPVAALIIDYGYTAPTHTDTFQAVRKHGYESPLASPGEADLSAHVNFYELALLLHGAGLAIDGPVTQAEFLGALGIVERATRLMKANPKRAGEIETAVARLIAPNGMGTRFKVIGVRSAGLPVLPGFAAAG